MKTHYCKADKGVISYEGECNWCGEKEDDMKEEALALADELEHGVWYKNPYTEDKMEEASAMIRRLVEELDKVPEVVFDEGVYRWNLPNGDEFVIVPQAQKRLSNHDLQKMWKGSVESCGWDSVIEFARAIEERHGIYVQKT